MRINDGELQLLHFPLSLQPNVSIRMSSSVGLSICLFGPFVCPFAVAPRSTRLKRDNNRWLRLRAVQSYIVDRLLFLEFFPTILFTPALTHKFPLLKLQQVCPNLPQLLLFEREISLIPFSRLQTMRVEYKCKRAGGPGNSLG